MSPRSQKLLKRGIVLMNSSSGAVLQVIALQYNPHSLTQSLQAQSFESQQGGASKAAALQRRANRKRRLFLALCGRRCVHFRPQGRKALLKH